MKTTMLKWTSAAMLLFNVITLQAQTTWTVDNTPNSGAQFTDIQSAINAASDGDTIYVQQSVQLYGDAIINKGINLIGRAYEGSPFYLTRINSIQFANGASNSKIAGVECGIISGSNTMGLTNTISNIVVQECILGTIDVSGGTTSLPGSFNNITISGNRIGGVTVRDVASNVIISNNIIGVLEVDSSTNTIIRNNNLEYSGGIAIRNRDNAPLNITDCVINSFSNQISLSGSYSFNNCHFYSLFAVSTAVTLQNNGAQVQNTSNCTFSGDPLFITQYTNRSEPNLNLSLQPSSPLISAGSNSGDIGFEAGFIFKYLGNPKGYPEVKITNYTGATSSNGTVTFDIEARSH
jgi:hypothetical protein